MGKNKNVIRLDHEDSSVLLYVEQGEEEMEVVGVEMQFQYPIPISNLMDTQRIYRLISISHMARPGIKRETVTKMEGGVVKVEENFEPCNKKRR